MRYRPEVDGLRALAVMPVILFHAGFNYFSGGFIGVDIFFVISGYLITTLIIEELETGNFSVVNFYERRARRILPVLFFVMAISIPISWILLPPFDLISFSKSLVAVPLFLSNFFFLKDGGYFETAAELKPLLHTWSLAVEEQYYLFFPIMLILFWKLGKRWTLNLIILLAVLSLILAQISSLYMPVPNFFLLPTRAWELAIGALIVFYFSRKNPKPTSFQARQFFSFLGFFLISVSIFTFDRSTPFPSFYSLIPTIGTALILLFAQPDTIIGRVLGSKPLVFIGLISYSAYLWHQPIFAFARFNFSSIGQGLMFSLVGTTFILSVLTWRYIERPIRNRNLISKKVIFISSALVSIFFISFGYVSYKIFDSYSTTGTEQKIAKALSTAAVVYTSNMDERKFIKFRVQIENLKPNAIVIGSSRIMQIGEHNYDGKVLNLGVSGASIEDDIAIADIAIKKFNPSTIFISADPWLFNSNSGQLRWKSLEDEYLSALSKISAGTGLERHSHEEAKESLLTRIGTKIYNAVHSQKLISSNDIPESRDKIRRDGSRIYNITYANKSQKEISDEFSSWIKYAMVDYEYSREYQDIFGSFIDSLSKKHKVVLILSPYHPDLFERMRAHYPLYLEIESKYRDFAKAYGVRIIGSYNPNKVGCTGVDFYDGMHPRDLCMGHVMKELNNSDPH